MYHKYYSCSVYIRFVLLKIVFVCNVLILVKYYNEIHASQVSNKFKLCSLLLHQYLNFTHDYHFSILIVIFGSTALISVCSVMVSVCIRLTPYIALADSSFFTYRLTCAFMIFINRRQHYVHYKHYNYFFKLKACFWLANAKNQPSHLSIHLLHNIFFYQRLCATLLHLKCISKGDTAILH